MDKSKVFVMKFSKIYPLYLEKVQKKGRTRAELDQVISWLTGYDSEGIEACIERDIDLEMFFNEAPRMNPRRHLITGTVCGVKLSEITDPMMLMLRQLDKLVDELAKGKQIDMILRKAEDK